MENNKLNDDWISVSQLAVQLGVTKQTIYNKIARGEYKTKVFQRGSMRGLLVHVPET